jgi:hypothetical protein
MGATVSAGNHPQSWNFYTEMMSVSAARLKISSLRRNCAARILGERSGDRQESRMVIELVGPPTFQKLFVASDVL